MHPSHTLDIFEKMSYILTEFQNETANYWKQVMDETFQEYHQLEQDCEKSRDNQGNPSCF